MGALADCFTPSYLICLILLTMSTLAVVNKIFTFAFTKGFITGKIYSNLVQFHANKLKRELWRVLHYAIYFLVGNFMVLFATSCVAFLVMVYVKVVSNGGPDKTKAVTGITSQYIAIAIAFAFTKDSPYVIAAGCVPLLTGCMLLALNQSLLSDETSGSAQIEIEKMD